MQLAPSPRRLLAGVVVLLGGLGVATALLLPFRGQVSIATAGLVLVVPVVSAVVVGGAPAGPPAVVLGFVTFDVVFIPPYGTFSVGDDQNWVTLGVYVAVALLVGRVVARLQAVRLEAARGEADARRLLELSESLVGDKPLRELLALVAASARGAFDLETVAVLLPAGLTATGASASASPADHLEMLACDGPGLGDETLSRLLPARGLPTSLTDLADGDHVVRHVPLSAAGRPVGLLVLSGRRLGARERNLLSTYANHAALAIERAQLRDEAVRARTLEEVDHWRGALLGTIAHDLRTPLASIKVAISDLRDPSIVLPALARGELLETIEEQTDRLTRLVANVLDLWRVRAGDLRPRREPVRLDRLLDEATALVQPSLDPGRLRRSLSPGLPLLKVDPLLVVQVLANLLENAARHSAAGAEIAVEADWSSDAPDEIEIAVVDRGQGVAPSERERIFEMFHRSEDGGRGGLGLAIAKAFVEAHGGRITVAAGREGGARFSFTLPAGSPAAERGRASDGGAR